VFIKKRSSAAVVGEVDILRGEEGKGGQRRKKRKRRRIKAHILNTFSLIYIKKI
jgi:hypothetical protein